MPIDEIFDYIVALLLQTYGFNINGMIWAQFTFSKYFCFFTKSELMTPEQNSFKLAPINKKNEKYFRRTSKKESVLPFTH